MEFEYRRKQGWKLNYRVECFVMRNAQTGQLSYRAKVLRDDGSYAGPSHGQLTSTDTAAAEIEAKQLTVAEIENSASD